MDLRNAVITDVVGVGTVHSPQGRTAEIENRVFYGLSLCIDGQITYTHKGHEYISDKYCAVILPQGGSYSLRGDKTGDFPVINFTSLYPLCDTVTVFSIRNPELLIKSYEEMKRVSINKSYRAKLISLFYGMLHEISLQNEVGELDPALKYIYENYTSPSITNARLAEECRLSEVYFRRLFTRQFKSSPKQFIIDLRIQKAKQLLCEGTQKIWAISEECGFSSTYHFCRLFKQHTGVTPGEYRKNNRTYAL